MFARVKYQLDGKIETVPTSYIQNFDHRTFIPGARHLVFWSPIDKETPRDILLSQGEILNMVKMEEKHGPKFLDKLPTTAGYYGADVLLVADTEAELEEKLTKKRLKFDSEKASALKAEKVRNKTTTSKDKTNKGADSSKKQKPSKEDILLQKSSSNKNIKALISCGKDDDEIKKMQTELENAKSAYQKVKKANLEVTEKVKSLEIENKELRELNMELQRKLLESLPPKVEVPLTPRAFASPASLHPSPRQSPRLIERREKLESVKKQLSFSEEAPAKDNSTQSQSLFSEDESAKNEPSPVKEKAKKRKRYEMSRAQLQNADLNVPSGKAGDSKYAKNVAVIVFSEEVLMRSSLYGEKRRGDTNAVARPALDIDKLNYVKEVCLERIRDELKHLNKNDDAILSRANKTGTYISDKIQSLRRDRLKMKVAT